jgi:NDP-sugar pyrophosphorylase family protein
MRVIIPVAGVGSRLRPHTCTVPKVLLNVGGKPIVGHIPDRLIENGFDEATIVSDTLLEDSIVGNDAIVRGTRKRVDIGDSSEPEFD